MLYEVITRKFIEEHPYVNVIRFTTFFHQFTLIFDELAREKYVDWYGYSASVSPYILEQFEQEAGYTFRPEFIIDQGYFNNTYRIPSKEFRDFQAFQRREVAKLAKEMVDIVVITSYSIHYTKLYDLALVYAAMALPFTIYLLSGYFKTLPKEYEEAASVDGAGYFRTMVQVIMPMAKPSIVTVILFNFSYNFV